MLAGLGVARDTLFVLDAVRRVTAFPPRGPASTQLVLVPSVGSLPLNPRLLSGRVIVLAQSAAPGHPIINAYGQLVVRAHADGRVIDTLGSLDVRDEMMRISLLGGQSEIQLLQPYVDIDRLAVSSGGAWVAIVRAPSSRYNGDARANAVEFIGPQGRAVVKLPVRSQVLSDATVRQWLDARARDFAGRIPGGYAAARSAVAAQLMRPESHPTVRAAAIGDDGVVWILQSPLDAPSERWTLLASTGEVIGSVGLPEGSRPIVVSRNGAWVVQERDDGEQEIVRYRVRE